MCFFVSSETNPQDKLIAIVCVRYDLPVGSQRDDSRFPLSGHGFVPRGHGLRSPGAAHRRATAAEVGGGRAEGGGTIGWETWNEKRRERRAFAHWK